jgi:hypothetical protein
VSGRYRHRVSAAALASLLLASAAAADWPASGKYVGSAADGFNGVYGMRFLDLPSGDLALILVGTGGSAFGYSIQRIGRGGELALGWPANAVYIGQWGKPFRPIWHGFVVDDSGCVWHGAPPQIGTGRVAQLIRPDAIVLPGYDAAWQAFTTVGLSSAPAVATAPAPGGAYVVAGGRIQRMTRAGTVAVGWPVDGRGTAVTSVQQVAAQPDGEGGAVIFAPTFSGPLAQRIDGNSLLHAGWPGFGLFLSSADDGLPDFGNLAMADPLIRSGSDGFIAGWGAPYNSGYKKLRLQRFLLDGTIDPAWGDGLEAIAVDSIASVTLIPDGLGGAHVLWYSLSSSTIRGTHVLVNGQFAPGLGPQGVELPAPGSLPHIPMRFLGAPLDYVTADAEPDGGLVFAWNDDALAPTNSIRVRWLKSDYTPDPSEPAAGRLIVPAAQSNQGWELRGVHADGVGGAFVAWQVFPPDGPPLPDSQIWMTRLLPSSLLGVPPVARGGSLALSAPHPNPSRGSVSFGVTLPDESPARIELLDIAGRVQRTQVVRGPGAHAVTFGDAGSLAPGLYFARVTSRAGAHSTRVVLAR